MEWNKEITFRLPLPLNDPSPVVSDPSFPKWVLDSCFWSGEGGRKLSVDPLRIYIWLCGRVTDFETRTVNGRLIPFGLVQGGNSLPFATIAESLNVSWRGVQRNVKYLESVGLLSMSRTSCNHEYSFALPQLGGEAPSVRVVR